MPSPDVRAATSAGRDPVPAPLAAQDGRQLHLFSCLARSSPDFIGMYDLSFRPFFVNEAGLRLVGLDSMAEALRLELKDFLFPEDRGLVFDRFFPAVARDGRGEIEIRFRHFRTGAPVWVRQSAFTLTDQDGAHVGFGTVSRGDPAERRRAERAVAESEARARAALAELEATYQSAPVGLCVLDRELRFVRINDRLAEMNGVSVTGHLGRTPREVVPALADFAERVAEQVFRTGEAVCGIELVGTTPADPGCERAWVEHWFPMKAPSGEVTGINVVVEEVTGERAAKQEREELLRRAEQSRAALERSLRESTALMEASRQLSQTLEMREVLSTLCRLARELLGADGTTFVLQQDDRVHHAEEDAARPLWKGWTIPADLCLSGRAIAERRTLVVEHADAYPCASHETYRPTAVKSHAVAPVRCGALLGALGAYWHETYRPRAEQVRLLEALADIGSIAVQNAQLFQKTSEGSRRKDEFLAMLAHELRNPLAPILNAVNVLRVLGPKEPRLAQAREIIHRQVVHMTRLIDDLLDVSRITRGRIGLKKERLALREVVEAAVEASRFGLEKHEHTLALNLADGVWVEGDRARLIQVVTNLLANAAKFTPRGGHIGVRMAAGPRGAFIAVHDTGIGIAPEAQERIFDLFAQEDASVDRAQGGLGIGLTLVKSLVEMHGGSVAVRSEGLGKGTEFVVTLPMLAGCDAGITALALPPARVRADHLRILVVEDREDAADSFRMLLELSGHAVEVARDGLEALRAFERFVPHVAFIDLGLPGIDGFGVAERVRAQGGLQPMLVALSGYGREEDKERARRAGFDEHMTKPVEHDRVQALLASFGASVPA